MLCNIKPVPFHESDKHIFAKIPGGGGVFPDPRSPPPLDPPMRNRPSCGECENSGSLGSQDKQGRYIRLFSVPSSRAV